MQPFSGNQRPDLLTSLMNVSLVLCLGKWILPGPLQMSHACHRFWKCYKTLTFCSFLTSCIIPCACHVKRHLNVQKCSEPVSLWHFWLRNVLRATTACTFSSSQFPKVVRTWCALYILTSKCVLRHNGVHFFIISLSKSGPNLVCFVHFDFEMCFAPQRRALFHHLTFQKWSELGVLCTFWLGNVLRATTAYNFSSLIWPAGSAPAALASLLFGPPEPQIIGKHSVSRLSYLFAHLDLSSETFSFLIFFSSLLFSCLVFSSLTLPISAFHLSTLSEVWLLNFLQLVDILLGFPFFMICLEVGIVDNWSPIPHQAQAPTSAEEKNTILSVLNWISWDPRTQKNSLFGDIFRLAKSPLTLWSVRDTIFLSHWHDVGCLWLPWNCCLWRPAGLACSTVFWTPWKAMKHLKWGWKNMTFGNVSE